MKREGKEKEGVEGEREEEGEKKEEGEEGGEKVEVALDIHNELELQLLPMPVLLLAERPAPLHSGGRVLKLALVTQAGCCPQRTPRQIKETISKSSADRGGLT